MRNARVDESQAAVKISRRNINNLRYAGAAAKSLQSCPTLWNPIDGSPPGSPVPGILQARMLEWVAISLSNAWKWKVKVKSLSCIRLSVIPWTAAYQAPPSMGFSRQSTNLTLFLTFFHIAKLEYLVHRSWIFENNYSILKKTSTKVLNSRNNHKSLEERQSGRNI